jgi:hypothetical protein
MGYSFTFKFSEKDIDFKPRSGHFFNLHKFLINEFFNSTDEEMQTIMKVYLIKFGESAYKYVMKTYYWGWRDGNRTLSNIQQERILSIMPELLNEKAKETLNRIKEEARYKIGIEEVVGGIKRTVESYFQNQRNIYNQDKVQTDIDLQNIFQKEVDRAKQLSLIGPFFVLDDTERAEVIKISKYIVNVKLQKQLDQIEKDFNTFIPFMQLVKRGILSASYSITALNITIDLTKKVFDKIKVCDILVEEIVANSRFKEFSDKYLLNELITINSNANKAVSNAFLNAHDIQLFFDHYNEISLSDSEVDMKSTFNGESGNLNIQIQMKSIKMLKTSIAKSLSKILIITIIVAGLVTVAMRNEWFSILFLGGGFTAIVYFGLLNQEIKLIKHFKTEIKQHEQQ